MDKKREKRSVLFIIAILSIMTLAMCLSVIIAVSASKPEVPLLPVIQYINGEAPVQPDGNEPVFQHPDSSTPDYVVLNDGAELRAVWVPYYTLNGLDAGRIEKIITDCREIGANAVVFHVRPYGDALYSSSFFPWSHVVTGTQGTAPADDFDPLRYAIDCAHANGMQLHAWVNPFRIQAQGGRVPDTLSPDNPYVLWRCDADPSNDTWVVDYKDGKYYNPGVPEVRQLIIDGMTEIAANYNVDAIQWDDYFYPAEDDSFFDSSEYNKYLASGGSMTLLEWRTENVNALVRDTYKAVKEANPNCMFGISPAGNISNCLAMGADVYKWGSESGYVDYLCPQVYWSFKSEVAPFALRCKAWRDIVTSDSVKLYIGLALYKSGTDSDNGQWLDDSSIIAQQIAWLRSGNIISDGFMLFSYDDFDRDAAADAMADIESEIFG